jgi:ubiquinone biosynthesis protein
MADKLKKAENQKKGRGIEILGVFAKHNFYANGLTPEELRTTLEDLGPTYVKIGQIMSSRLDLLPESYCKELEKLRQNVQELDPALARAVIEQETGKKIDEIYSEFRDKPLGSASVGQAHYGVLKDGRKVVTKVQRPFIADMMREDFVMLKKLAKGASNVGGSSEDDNQMDLVEVIEEFEKVTEEELDFRVEAANTRYFKENVIEDETKITCPEVIEELTTERIFTMTFVDGYSISKRDKIIEDGFDVEEIGRSIVDSYVHQVLDVGTFHADPHQGNLMVQRESGVPEWIDFGMIGRITESDIKVIQQLVLAVLEKDVETIANAVMSLGAASPKTNRDRLIEDLDVFMDQYVNVTSIDDLDISLLFEEICTLADKHHVKMPGRFTMLVRSLATIEGVIEQLCPSLNLFEIISGKLMDRAKQSFDLEQELLSVGKDALEISKKAARIPAQVSDVLKGVARGRTKINLELTGYEELLNKGGDSIRNIVLALFACIVFIGSCVLCLADITPKAPGGMPAIAAIGLIFSVALAIYTIQSIGKKK